MTEWKDVSYRKRDILFMRALFSGGLEEKYRTRTSFVTRIREAANEDKIYHVDVGAVMKLVSAENSCICCMNRDQPIFHLATCFPGRSSINLFLTLLIISSHVCFGDSEDVAYHKQFIRKAIS